MSIKSSIANEPFLTKIFKYTKLLDLGIDSN